MSAAMMAVYIRVPAEHLEEPDIDTQICGWRSERGPDNMKDFGKKHQDMVQGQSALWPACTFSARENCARAQQCDDLAVAALRAFNLHVRRDHAHVTTSQVAPSPATVMSLPTIQTPLDSSARWFSRSHNDFILPAAYS